MSNELGEKRDSNQKVEFYQRTKLIEAHREQRKLTQENKTLRQQLNKKPQTGTVDVGVNTLSKNHRIKGRSPHLPKDNNDHKESAANQLESDVVSFRSSSF